jgi:hypothetical protein
MISSHLLYPMSYPRMVIDCTACTTIVFEQRNAKPQSGPRQPESYEPGPEAARRNGLMIELDDLRKH